MVQLVGLSNNLSACVIIWNSVVEWSL